MSSASGSGDKTTQCDPPQPAGEPSTLVASVPGSPASAAPVAVRQLDDSAAAYGPYKLIRPLGEGGFGAVYEAEQEYPVRRRVALKLIKLGMDTREVIARFEAERQALALMEHPNIARVLDVGASDSGRPYFVMELVAGEPISSYCDRHQLSTRERLQLFEQVCAAVQHAHTKGIIHRDLKPSNVLVSRQDGTALAKVIDFGIAKATSGNLTDHGLLTAQLQMVGTPTYMSPEQAQGSADIDTRTDIYSLGVLLYQLLTGSTPFEARTLSMAHYAEMQRIICEVEPPRPSMRVAQSESTLTEAAGKRRMPPRKLIDTLRGELDWIVMKAIEKDRARRYETASALALDVRRYLDGEAVLAAPPGASYRLRKFVRRHRGAVAAGLLIAASLLAGIAAFAWQARIAQRRAEQLEQVARFQAEMLGQVDATLAGKALTDDVSAKFAQALPQAGVPETARAAQTEQFALLWRRVNATDAARDLIDRTILQPAVAAIDQKFADQPLVDAALRQVLADRYREMGLYDAAQPLQERALDLRRRLLGERHPDTLTSLDHMGELLLHRGKRSEAEPLVREALEQRRRVLGDLHPDTLQSINNMGVLLQAEGRLTEVETYLREALQGRRRVLGEEHASTLLSIANMGRLLSAQGKLAEAEPYYREALQKDRRVLGEEHPITLTAINDMSVLLQDQGKLDEAERYAREAQEKYRHVLGEDHSYTLIATANLAILLQTEGKLAEAEPYFRETLEKSRRLLGDLHPDTLGALTDMADLLRQQGKLDAAEALYREALQGRRRVLGDEHPETILSIHNIGFLLYLEGKFDQAEPLLREALDKNRRVLGPTHQATLSVTINLGGVLVARGRSAEADQLLTAAEKDVRATFTDSNAYRVAKLLMHRGRARHGQAQFAAAETDLLEAQAIFARTPGPNPRDARDCLRALVDLYAGWNQAEPGKGHGDEAAKWKGRIAVLPAG